MLIYHVHMELVLPPPCKYTTDHKHRPHPPVTECLTSYSLSNIFGGVQKAASQLYRMNVPLLYMSTHGPGTSLHVLCQYCKQQTPPVYEASTIAGM